MKTVILAGRLAGDDTLRDERLLEERCAPGDAPRVRPAVRA